MDPYKTIYRKDYVPKWTSNQRFGTEQEFPDPIREGFKSYLELSGAEPPPKPPMEDADAYVEKIKERYPKVGKMYYDQPLNNEVIKESFIANGRTAYQVSYCDLKKDAEYKAELARKNAFRLPDDWYVPMTTQKGSYRVPTELYSNALQKLTQVKAQNNLDPQEHIRKILNVKCGKTEYQRYIGKLGGEIIVDQIHGKIIHE